MSHPEVAYLRGCEEDPDGLHPSGFTKPGWYFWDETAYFHGPYDTEEAALEKLNGYADWLEGREPSPSAR